MAPAASLRPWRERANLITEFIRGMPTACPRLLNNSQRPTLTQLCQGRATLATDGRADHPRSGCHHGVESTHAALRGAGRARRARTLGCGLSPVRTRRVAAPAHAARVAGRTRDRP